MAINTLFTIGHSNRTADEFIQLLRRHGVEKIVDVRTAPKSRHNPQFWPDALRDTLQAAGMGYAHVAKLGGLRHSRKDSINRGWRNASFRGYADYIGTADFKEGLEELAAIARERTTAAMCAEAVPWRCHRSLIADAMTLRGWEVRDILTAKPAAHHKLTSFLKVVEGQITYPADEDGARER